MKTVSRNKSRMKKLQGKLRQKAKGGNYYYRLTVANGIRKEFALKTADETENLLGVPVLGVIPKSKTKGKK